MEFYSKHLDSSDFLFSNFTFIRDESNCLYFKGKEIAEFLGLYNPTQSIKKIVSEDQIILFKDIQSPIIIGWGNVPIQDDILCLTINGIHQLCSFGPKNNTNKKFKDWLLNFVIPVLEDMEIIEDRFVEHNKKSFIKSIKKLFTSYNNKIIKLKKT